MLKIMPLRFRRQFICSLVEWCRITFSYDIFMSPLKAKWYIKTQSIFLLSPDFFFFPSTVPLSSISAPFPQTAISSNFSPIFEFFAFKASTFIVVYESFYPIFNLYDVNEFFWVFLCLWYFHFFLYCNGLFLFSFLQIWLGYWVKDTFGLD